MSNASKIYMGISFGLGLTVFVVYFIYFGLRKKTMTSIGIKRVWTIFGLILSSNCFIVFNAFFDKIAAFMFSMPFFLIPGHVGMHPSVKENRRPISSGKNIWEKILIFFWY